jgi:hypothetical protein
MNDTNTIHEYVYNRKRQPVGVWAAAPFATDSSKVFIGFSLCNVKAGDKFDKNRGYAIAVNRSITGSTAEIPESMEHSYNFFFDRCKRYFKDRQVMV